MPHAVACAQCHYLSNHLGGVRVEYMYESDRKAWVRYVPPRWIYEGTAICGVPSEVSRAMALLVALGHVDAIGPSSWMIATRRSFGSLLSLAFVFWARKSVDMRPNWRPLGWERKTYLRFRFSSTAEEMHVVIHMNFLSCSTRAATGTHCAEE